MCYTFLTSFFCLQSKEDFPLRQNLVLAIVRENGRILMARLLHASVFFLHSYMLSDVSDVIVELILTDREVSSKIKDFIIDKFSNMD